MSCLNSRHLSRFNSRHLSCLNRRRLLCLNSSHMHHLRLHGDHDAELDAKAQPGGGRDGWFSHPWTGRSGRQWHGYPSALLTLTLSFVYSHVCLICWIAIGWISNQPSCSPSTSHQTQLWQFHNKSKSHCFDDENSSQTIDPFFRWRDIISNQNLCPSLVIFLSPSLLGRSPFDAG